MACCGRNNGECVCAKEATCSCGKQPALQCTCAKSATENKLPTSTCACGKRAEDSCTCSRSENSGSSSLETDFTTKK
ncbi:Nn.00g089330.m01.CDS01 [Neocucurbitaria sp. VM-36]